MNVIDINNQIQESLDAFLDQSNQQLEGFNFSKQTINLNGSYLFQDEESMEYLMNGIGLAVQRQGGQ